MEEIKSLLSKARKSVKNADHLVYNTYPLIKEAKLLKSAIENICAAIFANVDVLVYYDGLFKRIPFVPREIDAKIEVFRNKSARFHNLEELDVKLVCDIANLAKELKRSKIGIVKGDKFVICNDDYETMTITLEMVKGYINKTKIFTNRINDIIPLNSL